ncbi:hypothetical protein BEP19_07390 [Ammoniphilus oxalaticus]|uniref:Flagellar assembly factor FliW n=1 Tax=Ammoniphilus oxalaticus TaxID=66863 RepID=A0A419SJT4_9BACL|nr:flagellar assembly protein FliW [Ammoniphilus oxalaticus]RKD24220.1 hypothetical protein BEP19_07390 [Ammoniphilus oxalaticus]
MKLATTLFGELEIEQKQIVEFPLGLPGFADEQRFVFLPIPDSPFFSMQSVTSELQFFVMNPFELFKDYEFKIPGSSIELLQLSEPESVATWVILTLKDELANSTANMQAPIIVNSQTRIGKQLVLEHYQMRQPIFTMPPLALLG